MTGASSGIGRAIAERLLSEGRNVVSLGRRRPEPAGEGELTWFELDLSDTVRMPQRLATIQQALRETHTGSPIDQFIFCAGRGRFGALEEFSFAQIHELIDLNFTSTAFLVRAFMPEIKAAGDRARVVFLGSEAGIEGRKRATLYAASKFALRGFAQALRQDLSSSGAAVSLIQPGLVRTPFYDELGFEPGAAADEALEATDVAEAVCLALRARAGTVVEEVTLRPLKNVVRKRRPGTEAS